MLLSKNCCTFLKLLLLRFCGSFFFYYVNCQTFPCLLSSNRLEYLAKNFRVSEKVPQPNIPRSDSMATEVEGSNSERLVNCACRKTTGEIFAISTSKAKLQFLFVNPTPTAVCVYANCYMRPRVIWKYRNVNL